MNFDNIREMRPAERKALLDEIAAMVASGELRLGEAARLLRSAVLKMDRVSFAKATRLSDRAIAKLEDDPEANPTLETLVRVFAPFGGKIGLLFPRVHETAPLDDQTRARREAIRSELAKTWRRKRAR